MDEEEIKRRVIFGTGYGQPPKDGQFKKGQSGNPKGRPKTVKDEFSLADQRTLNMILDVADRTVPVRENGEVKYMTMREVAVNALFNKGAKGDPRALATVFALTQRGDIARALEIKKQNVFWQNYKDVETARILQAKARGEPTPQPLPHPDDIVIDHERGPRFIGPMTAQEQASLEHRLRLRDILILQDALDRRSAKRLNGEPLTEPGAAELLAWVYEFFMPPRLRLSHGEWLWRIMKAEQLSKPALLKRLYAEWRAVGHPRPRGVCVPRPEFDEENRRERIGNSDRGSTSAGSRRDAEWRVGAGSRKDYPRAYRSDLNGCCAGVMRKGRPVGKLGYWNSMICGQ